MVSATVLSESPSQVRYPGRVYPETHPDRLATLAILHGLEPAPIEHCRVLEIGCGDGSNLIPMALGLPDSEFVGLDLAQDAVARAQALIAELGLTRIDVRAMDLRDAGAELGVFDYVIAHGLYSWVPPDTREKLLALCSSALAPAGIAFISYNTYPAGHIRQISRDLMRYSGAARAEPAHSVEQGRAFLEFLSHCAEDEEPWKTVSRTEVERLARRDDAVTFHDELGEHFAPAYFSDFVAAAAHHGLQYLSEASLRDTVNSHVSVENRKILTELAEGDIVRYQQYLDFLLFRGFRRTLLCHASLGVQREGLAARLCGLHIATPLLRVAGSDGVSEFGNRHGAGIVKTNNPVLVAALAWLGERWPRAEPFAEVLQQVRAGLSDEQREGAESGLSQDLLRLAANGLVELRTYSPPLQHAPGETPMTNPLARLQARQGSAVTTLLHTHVDLEDAVSRRLLQLLDGKTSLREVGQSLLFEFTYLTGDAVDVKVRNKVAELAALGLIQA
jgi:SAM-dependent methyltransferase